MKKFIRRHKKFHLPMIWNKPGGEGNSPRGRKNGDQGPPDLDQILRNLHQKIKKGFFGMRSPRTGAGIGEPQPAWLILGAIVLTLYYAASGSYIVQPAERAVVTRFGKYVRTTGPGLHWLPPMIESKEIVNIEQVSTSDHSGLVLTKDGNIVSIGVAVQYRIGALNNDVRSYLFNVVNPTRSLSQSAESALRHVIGQFTMDEVLTQKRSEIATAIKEQIRETLKNYDTGISVLEVAMQFAKQPQEVQAAFDEVIKAIADEERLVNQAKAYENEILPRAKGTAERLKNEALGYKEETILIAEGNVQRFNLVLPQFVKSPKVLQTRMYIDAIEQVLTKTRKIVVDAGAGNNLIYLPLDRLMADTRLEEKSTGEPSTITPMPKEPMPLAVPDQKERSQ